jgi:hypothetical protein
MAGHEPHDLAFCFFLSNKMGKFKPDAETSFPFIKNIAFSCSGFCFAVVFGE